MSSSFGLKTSAEELAANCAAQIAGKVVITTGVSPGGIGAAFVEAIARQSPKLLVLAGRDPDKCKATADQIASIPNPPRTKVLELDLTSQARVRRAAEEVLGYEEPIGCLVNNAGIMAAPYSKTEDGIESQFATNHVGHFLFTNLIMPKLLASQQGPRIVCVSSDGYRLGPVRFQDYNFDDGRTYDPWLAYGQSKTSSNLFAIALDKRLRGKGLTAVSLHPGVIASNLMRFMSDDIFQGLLKMDRAQGNTDYWHGFEHLAKTHSQGAATSVYCAFHPDVEKLGGRYFQNSQVMEPEDMWCWGRDDVDADRLWRLSEKLVGQKFDF